jgi:RecB family endonuclease NucS
VDGLFIIQQVTEERRARGEETHMTFIDLEKPKSEKPMTQSLGLECGEL